MVVVIALLTLGIGVSFGLSTSAARHERSLAIAGSATGGATQGTVAAGHEGPAWAGGDRLWIAGLSIGLLATAVARALIGLPGIVLGAVAGVTLPRAYSRRREHRRAEALEHQLAELAESAALAVRGGLSVVQALEFAAEGAERPLADLLERLQAQQRLGTSFEDALRDFGAAIDTDDSRLLVLIVSVHARSGGNLAGALQEVASTIRHRVSLRRELKALSAQGRISGAILGTLPIGFFLVLASASHDRLAPVYRSPAGLGMIAVGLVMEALAFLWIRRLLRVEA